MKGILVITKAGKLRNNVPDNLIPSLQEAFKLLLNYQKILFGEVKNSNDIII